MPERWEEPKKQIRHMVMFNSKIIIQDTMDDIREQDNMDDDDARWQSNT